MKKKIFFLILLTNILNSLKIDQNDFNALFVDNVENHPEIDKLEQKKYKKYEIQHNLIPAPKTITNISELINQKKKDTITNFENLPEMKILKNSKGGVHEISEGGVHEKNSELDISDLIKNPKEILGVRRKKLFNWKRQKRKLGFLKNLTSAFMSKAEIAERVKLVGNWKKINLAKVEPWFLEQKKKEETHNDKLSDKYFNTLLKNQQESNKLYAKNIPNLLNNYNNLKKKIFKQDLKKYKKEIKKNRPFKIKQIRGAIKTLMKNYFNKFMRKNKFEKDQFKNFRKNYYKEQKNIAFEDYEWLVKKRNVFYGTSLGEEDDEDEEGARIGDDKKKVMKDKKV